MIETRARDSSKRIHPDILTDVDNDELIMSNGFELQDELQLLQDASSYEIPNEHDVHKTETGPLLQRGYSRRTSKSLLTNPSSQMPLTGPHTIRKPFTEPEIFDVFQSLLKHADAALGALMNKLLDSIASGFSAQIDAAIRDSREEDQQIIRSRWKCTPFCSTGSSVPRRRSN